MIDFHNHIIPNLDDGSKSIEMSLNMLKEAESQGITDIINTVHFQHPKMEGKNTSYDFVIDEINKYVQSKGEIFACGTCLVSRNKEGTPICPMSSMKEVMDLHIDLMKNFKIKSNSRIFFYFHPKTTI